MLYKNQIDSSYFAREYASYDFDEWTSSYFWKIEDLVLSQEVYIDEILMPQNTYETRAIKVVTRQKIEL